MCLGKSLYNEFDTLRKADPESCHPEISYWKFIPAILDNAMEKWDDRTRGNFLNEMLIAYRVAGQEAKAMEVAKELDSINDGDGWGNGKIFGQFLSRWQQGAR